jgi:hypothetical protein
MDGRFLELNGIKIYEVSATGPELRSGTHAVHLISAAAAQRAAFIAIPVQRLGDDFFELRTRIAGELVQKFAMYGARVAIVGNIHDRVMTSRSLSALVAESNRGRDLWFVDSLDELATRLMEERFRASCSQEA